MNIRKEELFLQFAQFFSTIGFQREISTFRQKIVMVDNFYRAVDSDDMSAVIQANPLLQHPPTYNDSRRSHELSDCDDFALQFKASITSLYRHRALYTEEVIPPPAVGILLSKNHALNIIYAKAPTGELGVFMIDTMLESKAPVNDTESCAAIMRRTGLKMIYI